MAQEGKGKEPRHWAYPTPTLQRNKTHGGNMRIGDLVREMNTGRLGILLGRPTGYIATWRIKWLDNGKPPIALDREIRVIS